MFLRVLLRLQFALGLALALGGFGLARANHAQHISAATPLPDHPGSVDVSFDPGTGINGPERPAVYAIAVQADGKLVIGGSFTNIGGAAITGIARLNPDGSRDTNFNIGSGLGSSLGPAYRQVNALAIQPNGKIVLAGYFETVRGITRYGVARLHPDGSVDQGFEASTRAFYDVENILIQKDGKLVIGNQRLNTNGTRDATFSVAFNGPGFLWRIHATALQPDGMILMGGVFTEVNGRDAHGIVRLRSNGVVDTNFNPSFPYPSMVQSIALQPDGGIVAGGNFGVVRLHPDGRRDPNFNPLVTSQGEEPRVSSVALQTDGRVIIGGLFQGVSGMPRTNVARLNVDGTVDLSFDPGAGVEWDSTFPRPWVEATAFQADAKILIGGYFSHVGRLPRRGIARLESNRLPPAAPSVIAAPENQQVRAGLPAAFRVIADGFLPLTYQWQFNGTTLIGATNAGLILPAVGLADAGGYSVVISNSVGSVRTNASLIVEAENPPVLVYQPGSLIADSGQTVTFSVLATSISPASYQWFFNQAPLVASTNASITFVNVRAQHAGDYWVVVRNAGGSVTSHVAMLTIKPEPTIPGYLDPSFDPGTGTDNPVYALATQSDGRVLLGGIFATVNGVPRNQLARLQSDGGLDPDFNPPLLISCCGFRESHTIKSIAVQKDDKIIIAGNKGTRSSGTSYYVARLQPDGSHDAGFAMPAFAGSSPPFVIPDLKVVLQPDGRILVAGPLYQVSGTARNGIARLNPDGTLDLSFEPRNSGYVTDLTLQPDGRIIIIGEFPGGILRLNADGTIDSTFDPGSGFGLPSFLMNAVALRDDGTILVGGNFTAFNGVPRRRLVALKSDGSLDSSFSPGTGPDAVVRTLFLQKDGKALVGGSFSNFGGFVRRGIARVYLSGSVDAEFDPGRGLEGAMLGETSVRAIIEEASGKIVIGGAFTQVDGKPRSGIARLLGGGSAAAQPPQLVTQPLRQALNEGQTLRLFVEADSTAPVTYQWQFNGVDLPGATDPMLSLENLRVTNAGGYRVIVGNVFGAVTSVPAVINVNPAPTRPGLPDVNFYSDLNLGPNFPWINCLAVETNGNILAGGRFQFINTGNAILNQGGVARLKPDGDFDASFHPMPGTDFEVNAIAPQPGGQVLIAGSFGRVNGVPRAGGIARLQPDGALDLTFNPVLAATNTFSSRWVSSLLVEGDGRILIGGGFNSVNATNRNGIARLFPNGALDPSFDPGNGATGQLTPQLIIPFVRALARQKDGKIIVGGNFTQFDGAPRRGIARIHPDGRLDTGFAPGAGTDSDVTLVAADSENKVLLGGPFIMVNGERHPGIARLNSDGSLDRNFNPGTKLEEAINQITAFALQADGKILVAGYLRAPSGVLVRAQLVRLHQNGAWDFAFDSGSGLDSVIESIVVLPNDQVLVGGAFTTVNGVPRPYVARLHGGSSIFLLTPVTTSNGGITLSLPTSPAQKYFLEFAESLVTPTWQVLGMFEGDGSIRALQDTNPPPGQRFYRVRVEP